MTKAAQRKPGEANPIVQLGVLVAILVVIANAGFYFLSDAYFDDRVKRFGIQELGRLGGVRMDFGFMSVVVGAATVLSAMYPRIVGHAISAAAGLASLIAVPFAFEVGMVLPLTLLTVAGAYGLLIWHSWHRSRAAWSCLAALCVVYSVVTFFGAPKIAGLLPHVGMWSAMIAPGLLAVATAALARIRDDYRVAA